MKTVKILNSDKVAMVSDRDWPKVRYRKWWLDKTTGYAKCNIPSRELNGIGQRSRKMQKVIFGDVLMDHRNNNRLDCRRCNMRPCTKQQNNQNRLMSRNNTSGYRGVWKHKSGKWHVECQEKYLGSFVCVHDAGRAYNRAAKKFFGR